MTSVGDFDIGGFVGRSRPRAPGAELGDGDIVRAVRKQTNETLAMRRVEATTDSARAKELLKDLSRAAHLKPHAVWLGQRPDCNFVHEYVDNFNVRHLRCCVLEELADASLEQELIQRAVQNQPFVGLLRLWSSLLHGLQAFHAQGCLHRGVGPRGIFFKDGSVRLGLPGPEALPATEGFYLEGRCDAYSADIFAMGMVFLEMALLHPSSDLVGGGPDAVLLELQALDGSVDALRTWLWDRCTLLGLPAPEDHLVDVLGAMLAPDPCSRPTADDLLDWPCFAPFVDVTQLLPIWRRPCVRLAHRPGMVHDQVPVRSVMSLPGFHQLFCAEGAEQASREGSYRWCCEEHRVWWFGPAEPHLLRDHTDLTRSVQPGPGGGDEEAFLALLSAADEHRAAARLLAAEAAYCAALAEPEDGEAPWRPPGSMLRVWLGRAATLIERGNFMAARRCFDRARQQAHEDDAAVGGVLPAVRDARLFGLCELLSAAESLAARCSSAEAADLPAAMREVNVSLYFRSQIALEVGSWEVLAALGEFYRLVGCPESSLSRPAPDAATALSYFEQAKTMAPQATFVQMRLALLSEQAATTIRGG